MKEKTDYVYSSTELSRYYGISIKGMEFYEQKNLVHPERIHPGNTRRYNLIDCYQLAAARMLRNCGFRIDETSTLLEQNRPDFLESELAERTRQIEAGIRHQEGILRGIQRIREGIRRIEAGDTRPRLLTHEGFFRLFVRFFSGAHTSTREESEQFSQWNSLMPITEASLRFNRDALVCRSPSLSTEIGMIISSGDFGQFSLESSDRVSHIAPGQAVYGIVEGPETDLDSPDRLREMLDFIEQQHLEIIGDGFSRLIFVMQRTPGVRLRYDEVWIPVSAKAAP